MRDLVRNLFCIGRNYAEHARELKSEIPKEPLVFLKPTSSICGSGALIRIPGGIGRVDHEVEVVLRLGKPLSKASEAEALAAISHYAVGIDVTARELQDLARSKGLPWTFAKGMDTFAPLSEFVPAAEVKNPLSLDFSLRVGGELRQRGNTSEMLFPIPTLLAYLSRYFALGPGDLVFTGTPEGVAPLHHGDRLVAELGGGLARLEAGVEIQAS